MNRPAKIVSRDSLDNFISSYNKFANREDLVDTDSESESESADFAQSTMTQAAADGKSALQINDAELHSIRSFCIPQLESALFEHVGSKKADTIEVS